MITDVQVSALCEIARSAGIGLSSVQQAVLPDLLGSGHVARSNETLGYQRYTVTPSGQAILDGRGVGANES